MWCIVRGQENPAQRSAVTGPGRTLSALDHGWLALLTSHSPTMADMKTGWWR
jgi:hypothetical protein